MSLEEVEQFAGPIVKEYLTKNNFDGLKIKEANPVVGTLIYVNGENIMTVELYIPKTQGRESLIFVSININVITQEYDIIPGHSPELAMFKR